MANPILLYNAIYSDVAERITEQVLSIPQDEEINLWINSPGGSVSAGWSILGVLKDRVVNMNVMGDASSMAFVMLLFADNTEALETSKFMIHRASTWWEEDLSEDQKADLVDRNKLVRSKLEAKINQDEFTKITGKTFDDIFSMKSRIDVTLNAKQAKKIGLIKKINKLNVKALAEVEARYYNEVMALSGTQTNNKTKDMGMFDFLSSKETVLLAIIGENQCVYAKAEKGSKVKAIGGADIEVTGNFEASNKKITVVKNEITAVEEINMEAARIEALEAKIIELTAMVETSKEAPKVTDNTAKMATLEASVEALTKVITDAKLMVSKPKIPVNNFNEAAPVVELTAQERLVMEQTKAHEATINAREES